jgi:16S rRNA A1518/A1519 N6-dimethyltransferase RsmA/KsgA/DIM1 with predicted DNA glycosylase/AP lyase activity
VAALEQHFLVDGDALAWIVERLDPQPGEVVVELGAGAGTIAAALRRVVAARDLVLVELDPGLADGLRRSFPGVRVEGADWRTAWSALPAPDALVVSLPDAHVAAVLHAIATRPPRVAVVAVAAGRSERLPHGLVRTAQRALPRRAFAPPQPFDGEAWVLRRAGDRA